MSYYSDPGEVTVSASGREVIEVVSVTDGMKAMFVENAALLPKPYTVDQLQTTLTVNFGIKPLAARL